MVQGHCREAWERQSHLMATMVNLQVDPQKNQPVTPAMFNPFTAEAENAARLSDANAKAARLIAAAVAKEEHAHGQPT
jgi:hypothetical protein